MTNKPTILFVEDNRSLVRAIRSALPNCDLIDANNLREGLDRLNSGEHYDLIMVNLNYTDDTNDNLGLEILEFIKENMPETPRIVVTGQPTTKPVNEFFFKDMGVSELFIKGESMTMDLRRIVNRLLGSHEQIRIKERNEVKRARPRAAKSGIERESFRLAINQTKDPGSFEIVTKSSQGEARVTSQLELDPELLFKLLWKIQQNKLSGEYSIDDQIFSTLGLESSSHPEFILEKIGRVLYDSLFIENVRSALQATLNILRPSRGIIDLELAFDEHSVRVAQFPWELLHDGRRYLLSGGMVDLTRYINYPEAATELQVDPPLSVLYVRTRPKGTYDAETTYEEDIIYKSLAELEQTGMVRLDKLWPPTFDNLIEYLEENPVHVLHFDGDGAFGCKCPSCDSINFPGHTVCQNKKCNHDLKGIVPYGYLGFEKADGETDWVDSKSIEQIIYRSDIRLAVLSSCQTSQISGNSVFSATGPALIQAGVPAVLSMQLPITPNAALQFMNGFYSSLSRFDPLILAMSNGRRRIARYSEWFIPTLYLRSKDNAGILFSKGKQNG
jgi:CheY-like chemotaxis protein